MSEKEKNILGFNLEEIQKEIADVKKAIEEAKSPSSKRGEKLSISEIFDITEESFDVVVSILTNLAVAVSNASAILSTVKTFGEIKTVK